VNTPAFKKARVSFQDMVYREAQRVAGPAPDGTVAANVTRLGNGVNVIGTSRNFATSDFKKTDDPFDLAIRGDGFIEVAMPDGAVAYFRGGSLQVNRDGLLATPTGMPLRPSLAVPADAQQLTIDSSGHVLATVPTQANPVEIGRIELARFTNAAGLAPLGDNLYQATDASGDARTGRAGEDGLGTFAQGFVETSNVKLIEEMIELMIAQRAYEVNTKVVQASDEIMAMTNNLRK
jgi:flagellar basal-body rod protein FlgG